jgi:hypothetical protein
MDLVDTIEATIYKRHVNDMDYGIAMLGEGSVRLAVSVVFLSVLCTGWSTHSLLFVLFSRSFCSFAA